jgi:hypothetical protein
MLKEVKMFTIICDGCGKDVNDDTDYSAWNDESYVDDIRQEADWEKVDDKHYCTDCYEYDDDDEIIIKSK